MVLEPPESVQKLQTALQAKAKGTPSYRFYLLYDKLYRRDVLRYAYDRCKANKGAPGADGQDFADIEAYGKDRWLDELAERLRHRKTYRPEAVRRVWISGGGRQDAPPARDSADCRPRGDDGGDGGAGAHLRSRHAGGTARVQTEPERPHGGHDGGPLDQWGTHAGHRRGFGGLLRIVFHAELLKSERAGSRTGTCCI